MMTHKYGRMATLALLALSGCGHLSDGFFSGQEAITPGGATTTGSTTSASPRPSGSPSPSSSGTPISVVCDTNLVVDALSATEAAMTDSAIPNTAAFVMQAGGNPNASIAVYYVFPSAPSGASHVEASLFDTGNPSRCSPCIVATYNGKAYIPESGLLDLDFTNGLSDLMKVSLSNAQFAPADGVGGGWCLQNSSVTSLPLQAYQCGLVGAANNCVTVAANQASVTCAGDGSMHVVQDCSATGKTCSAGSCQ